MIRSHFIKLNVPLFLKGQRCSSVPSPHKLNVAGMHIIRSSTVCLRKGREGKGSEVEGRIRVEESSIFKTH